MQPGPQAQVSAPPMATARFSGRGSRPGCVCRAERGVRWVNISPSVSTHNTTILDFPGASVVKNLPADAGDTVSIPGWGRFHVPRVKEAHLRQLEKARVQQQRPSAAKNNLFFFLKTTIP